MGNKNAKAIPKLQNPQADVFDHIDAVLFDCDGVIWHGYNLIDGVPEMLEMLQKLGKKYYFVSNNSTLSRRQYMEKFKKLGIDQYVTYDMIVPTAFAVVLYLQQQGYGDNNEKKKVMIVGEQGIQDELTLAKIPWVGGSTFNDRQPDLTKGKVFDVDENVTAVVCGYDRNINYYKLNYAQVCINQNKAEFVATNLDATTHQTRADQEWAGGGTMVAAVQGCCPKHPYRLVGKPAEIMVDYVADQVKAKDRQRLLMVGDRLDTDMAFGRQHGLRCVLTLGGCTGEDELVDVAKDRKPDFYIDSVKDFLVGYEGAAGDKNKV